MSATDEQQAEFHRVLSLEESAQVTQAFYDRYMTSPEMRYPSRVAWEKRRAEIRSGVQRALGLDPWPPRPDLDVHTAGVLQRDGYTVTRLYWQSFPDIYASGYLYLPEKRESRLPAILCPHGHWPNGARDEVVQARCILFAKLGYIVLTIDSTHSYDYPTGASPLTGMIWNDIRGVDLLCARDDVDASRIGCTGASGGAQQTFYLMALDDRIAVAAPVCMVSWFKHIITNNDFAHCWCNHIPGIAGVADTPEITAVFAPKPAFFISVSGDWTAGFSADEYPAIRGIYELYSATDRIAEQRWEWKHDYNKPMREAVATWFNRWLKNDASPVLEPDYPVESPETLLALSSPPPREGVVWGAHASAEEWNRAVAHFFRSRIRSSSQTEWTSARATQLRRDLQAFLGESPRSGKKTAFRNLETQIRGSVLIDKAVIESEPGAQIPALAIRWATGASDDSIILAAHSRGKEALFNAGNPTTWLREHLTWGDWVFAVDVRFRGELANVWPGPDALGNTWVDPREKARLSDKDVPGSTRGQESVSYPRRPSASWNGIIFGRPETVLAVRDLRAALDYLLQPPHEKRRITLVGEGSLGLAALLTAAIDDRVAEVHADVPCTYMASTGRGEGPEASCLPIVPGLLRLADIPEIAALIAPRICVLGLKPDPTQFEILRKAYSLYPASPPPVFRELSVVPGDRNNPHQEMQAD